MTTEQKMAAIEENYINGNIQYAEGGIWAIPACFMRTKKASEFFGN